MEKHCKLCNLTLSTEAFYKNARGYSSYCKTCMRGLSKAQYAEGYAAKRRTRRNLGAPSPRRRMTVLEKLAARTFCNIRKRTRALNREFSISQEFITTKFIEFSKTHYYETTPRSPFLPSIDRIDNRIGYRESNVRVVWLIENLARNTFTDKQVIEFCHRKLASVSTTTVHQ